MKNFIIALLLLSIVYAIYLDYQDYNKKIYQKNITAAKNFNLPIKGNKLTLNPNDKNTYEIVINPPTELDFLSKEKIFSLRKKYVVMQPKFIDKNYAPAEIVYGQIESNKPWWGQIGINCRMGPTTSLEGLSEESRFLNNPLLLLGVDTNYAFDIPTWNCSGFYPEPISIKLNPASRTIDVIYYLSHFFKQIEDSDWTEKNYIFSIKGENARDFGYGYVYAFSTKNVEFASSSNVSTQVCPLLNFIHLGQSCKYPGGCNNGSPMQSELGFDVLSLPANIQMKLWVNSPSDKNNPADLLFNIYFK